MKGEKSIKSVKDGYIPFILSHPSHFGMHCWASQQWHSAAGTKHAHDQKPWSMAPGPRTPVPRPRPPSPDPGPRPRPLVMIHPAALPFDALLKECEVRRLRRSGPGGQHRNKVETAVG